MKCTSGKFLWFAPSPELGEGAFSASEFYQCVCRAAAGGEVAPCREGLLSLRVPPMNWCRRNLHKSLCP